MRIITGIDPGPVKSAYVVWTGQERLDYGIVDNEQLLLDILPKIARDECCPEMAIEKITSYGMIAGESVFETVFWTGRFYEIWTKDRRHRIPRMDVKMHFCHNSRAKDSNIRQALIDRFEPNLQPRCRPKGVLKGISKDCWQALAIAVYYHDTHRWSGDSLKTESQ